MKAGQMRDDGLEAFIPSRVSGGKRRKETLSLWLNKKKSRGIGQGFGQKAGDGHLEAERQLD